MELYEELGYRINREILRHEYEKALGRPFTDISLRWFEAIAPYAVMGYQAGRNGKELSETFKFLEVI